MPSAWKQHRARAPSAALAAACAWLSAAGGAAAGCGVAVEPLEAFDVVLTPIEDCTLTGATSRDCVDPGLLAQRRSRGRWILQHGANSAFTVTTTEGTTVAGIHFADDGREPAVEPTCSGLGGLCYFGRTRFESIDEDNNGCARFGSVMIILRRVEDGTFTGVVADAQGSSEACGTASVVQRVLVVDGVIAAEPALAYEEAQP